jgi:AcrR family transcriptional regulator
MSPMPGTVSSRKDALRVASLRGRAIDAALSRVEASGVEALNLRDLAADLCAGASSLYHYFANKDALMAELAREGFRRLRDAFEDAARDPRGRLPLHACGEAYLNFARRHPQLYRVMYSEQLLAGQPAVKEAESAAFRAFARGISPDGPSDGVLADRALALWAFGRGIAALTMSAPKGDDPRELSRQIVRGLESLMGQSVRTRLPRSSAHQQD